LMPHDWKCDWLHNRCIHLHTRMRTSQPSVVYQSCRPQPVSVAGMLLLVMLHWCFSINSLDGLASQIQAPSSEEKKALTLLPLGGRFAASSLGQAPNASAGPSPQILSCLAGVISYTVVSGVLSAGHSPCRCCSLCQIGQRFWRSSGTHGHWSAVGEWHRIAGKLPKRRLID